MKSRKDVILAYERYRYRRTVSSAQALTLAALAVELAALPPGPDPVEIEVALMFERYDIAAPA